MTLWQGEIDHDSTIWSSSFYYAHGLLIVDIVYLTVKSHVHPLHFPFPWTWPVPAPPSFCEASISWRVSFLSRVFHNTTGHLLPSYPLSPHFIRYNKEEIIIKDTQGLLVWSLASSHQPNPNCRPLNSHDPVEGTPVTRICSSSPPSLRVLTYSVVKQ